MIGRIMLVAFIALVAFAAPAEAGRAQSQPTPVSGPTNFTHPYPVSTSADGECDPAVSRKLVSCMLDSWATRLSGFITATAGLAYVHATDRRSATETTDFRTDSLGATHGGPHGFVGINFRLDLAEPPDALQFDFTVVDRSTEAPAVAEVHASADSAMQADVFWRLVLEGRDPYWVEYREIPIVQAAPGAGVTRVDLDRGVPYSVRIARSDGSPLQGTMTFKVTLRTHALLDCSSDVQNGNCNSASAHGEGIIETIKVTPVFDPESPLPLPLPLP